MISCSCSLFSDVISCRFSLSSDLISCMAPVFQSTRHPSPWFFKRHFLPHSDSLFRLELGRQLLCLLCDSIHFVFFLQDCLAAIATGKLLFPLYFPKKTHVSFVLHHSRPDLIRQCFLPFLFFLIDRLHELMSELLENFLNHLHEIISEFVLLRQKKLHEMKSDLQNSLLMH